MKTTLIAGTTLLLAGVAAFAFARDDRDEKTVETPQVQAAAPETKTTELADPGKVEEPPAAEEPAAQPLPKGWEVDDTGFVWKPLSFKKPQVRNNGDGTITMRKLIRVYQNGKMREIPITATATPVQKRLPAKFRVAPKAVTNEGSAEVNPVDSQDGE